MISSVAQSSSPARRLVADQQAIGRDRLGRADPRARGFCSGSRGDPTVAGSPADRAMLVATDPSAPASSKSPTHTRVALLGAYHVR